MPESYFQSLLQRYQRGECTPAEAREVERWYTCLEQHAPANTPLTAAEQALLGVELWDRIAQQTGLTTPVRPLYAPQPWYARAVWRWSAAAALALGVAATALWQLPVVRPGDAVATVREQSGWQVQTTPGRLTLPDGSTVVLAARSQLRYPLRFGAAHRQVFLIGEATFDVTHNPRQPFEVYTRQMLTTVLGTSFRVRAYAGQPDTRVQVLRGKVRVQPRPTGAGAANQPAPVVVLPNQQAIYSQASHDLRKDLVERPALLTPPSTRMFADRPVPEVVATLEQAYGVEILYDKNALAHCTVTLVLQDGQLFDNLKLLCKVLGATYELSNARVLLRSQGCRS